MFSTKVFKFLLVFLCLGLAVQDGFAAIRATKIVNEQGRQINGGLLGKITQWLPEETWKKAAIAAAVIGVPAVLLIGGGMWRHFKKRKGGITDAEKPREKQSRAVGQDPNPLDLSTQTQSQDPDNKAGDPKKGAVDEKNSAAQPQNPGQMTPVESSPVQVQERQEDVVSNQNTDQQPKAADVASGVPEQQSQPVVDKAKPAPATKEDAAEQFEKNLHDIVDTNAPPREQLKMIYKQRCPNSMSRDELLQKRREAAFAIADNVRGRSDLNPIEKLREIQGFLQEATSNAFAFDAGEYKKCLGKHVADLTTEVVEYLDKQTSLNAMQKLEKACGVMSNDFSDADSINKQLIDPLLHSVEQEVNDFSRYPDVESYLSALRDLSGAMSAIRKSTHSAVSFAEASQLNEDIQPGDYLQYRKAQDYSLRALMHDDFDCSWLEGDYKFANGVTNAERRNELIGTQLRVLIKAYAYAKGKPTEKEVHTAVISSLNACKSLPQTTPGASAVLPKILQEEANKKDIRENMLTSVKTRGQFDALPADVKAAFESICGSN